ncbi:hypothetical protein DL96DRAFT_1574594 [Flagelloscypha sp. PMI_526]|nr:hypothetical protein DL96DRAFT_1574594 [Flagelloscypha sp. PMI_526]
MSTSVQSPPPVRPPNTTVSARANGPPSAAPTTLPPNPPKQQHTHSNNHIHNHPPNGTHPSQSKAKKRNDAPVDPAAMYESLKNRIAALEEEEVIEEEEERRFAEEAHSSVKGLEESAMHAKYIELFAEFKRLERDHAKEKQKLVKDKDAAKSQLVKANQTKTKMENLARELQKDNKRLREDGKHLTQTVQDAQDKLSKYKRESARSDDRAKARDAKYRESPDIVVKVVCRYRAELFFKISRKTKLSRLFNAWTDRMEKSEGQKGGEDEATNPPSTTPAISEMQFIFTHNGRSIAADQTPEDANMEEGDEIVAIELMDLTHGDALDEWADASEIPRETLKKNWTDDPLEAKRTLGEIFDSVVRERLKEVLRQYELRERHFECVIRSKELEVLLSRARATEQKQVADGERVRTEKLEQEAQILRKEVEEAQTAQALLIDKLIQCCKEIVSKPNAERTQSLFASLKEELEKKRPRQGSKRSGDNT